MSGTTNSGRMPRLRFPEFRGTEHWQTKFLGSLCKIRTGKKDANEGAPYGPYPFFTCAENHIFSYTYSFDAEAILIAGNANVGQTKYYNGKFEAYQRTYVLTDFSGIKVSYLYAILSAKLRNSLLAHVQVSAMSYIKLPMLQKYVLMVPQHPAEQQKIADCLSSLDDLITLEAQKLDSLKAHKKGLMQQLFPREGETQPRLRFPEFQEAGDWNMKRLEAIAPLQRGFDLPSNDVRPGSVPIIYSNGPKGFHERGMAKGPGLVTGRSGTIGKLHFIESGDYWPHNTSLWVTSFKGNTPKFVYYLYESINFLRFASGSGVPTLNRNDAHSFEISVPCEYDEQQRIADCLSSIDDLITAQTQKLEALKTHKKGLMQQLFPQVSEK